jgi:methylenetetrahydrofolate reductase (NADPH)
MDNVARAGIDIPIIAGIMPITNYASLARFSDACGAEIPRWIRLKLQSYGDDLESIREFGLDVVTRLCERLLEGGSPGFHFYSLNQAAPVEELFKRLQASTGYRV